MTTDIVICAVMDSLLESDTMRLGKEGNVWTFYILAIQLLKL